MPKGIRIYMPETEMVKMKWWIRELSVKNRQQCSNLVYSTARDIERRAKMFAPVGKEKGTGSGHLKGAIHTNYNPSAISADVYVWKLYAPYQEFGTGRFVNVPADVYNYGITNDYLNSIRGRGKRKINMRSQPYLFPAVRISINEMYGKLKDMGFYL